MATVTVRVAPRSGRTAVEIGPDGIVVRVRSAAETGRPPRRPDGARGGRRSASVRRLVRSGSRSRTKVFEVSGPDADQLERRLRGI